MKKSSIVGISGSLSVPSRTSVLVKQVLKALQHSTGHSTQFLELSASADALFQSRSPKDLTGPARDFIDTIEQADLLVVGSPVYRASYTGALKHVFDLVDHRRFSNKPVVLTATGGTPLHGLMIDHQLRPLFGFLQALSLPTTLYAVETDFTNYEISNPELLDRIARVAAEASPYVKQHLSFGNGSLESQLAATA